MALGGDTRDSTPEVASWVERGLVAAGAEVANAGVVPTPAVAALVRELGAAGGVSISASHNPWRDNGVKLFDALGFKWSQEEERRLEGRLREAPQLDRAAGRHLDARSRAGRALPRAPARARCRRQRALDGLHIAIDAANGAASPWARRLFEAAGARVESFHDQPDGENINVACGSTVADEIARLVRETGCDLGVAFDGDADRCMVADDDRPRARRRRHPLPPGARPQGARRARPGARRGHRDEQPRARCGASPRVGIDVVRCGVGDREVVEEMRRSGASLGGEQSGHLLDLELGSTGDGLQSALQVALLVARAGAPLSRLAAPFETFPQTLHNVKVSRKEPFEQIPGLTDADGRDPRRGSATRVACCCATAAPSRSRG